MLIPGIFVTFLLGLSLIHLVHPKATLLESLGFSTIVGLGIQTFVMFLMSVAGVLFNVYNVLIVSFLLIILFSIAGLIKYRTVFINPLVFKRAALKTQFGSINAVMLVCLGLSAYIVCIISLKALYWPTYATDAIGTFDLFAKALANEGTIINSVVLEQRVGNATAYPPLYSLGVSYFYMLGTSNANVISVVFLVSFFISFYALLLKTVNSTAASFFTLAALCTPEFIAQSAVNITNGPHATYAISAIAALFVWIKNKTETGYIGLSSVLLACSGFTRSESVVMMLPLFVIVAYFTFYKKEIKITQAITYVLIAVLPFVSWQLFLKAHIDVMDYFVQVEMMTSPNLSQWGTVWDLAYHTIISEQYYGYTLSVFVIAVCLTALAFFRKKDYLYSLGLLACILAVFFGYLILINQMKLRSDTIQNIVGYSGKRFFFTVVVLAWFFAATNYYINKLFDAIHSLLSMRVREK